ncbi:hypothetical protein GPALN_003680 [Globodera pallida]|nr:hypothetical protein GPALN_003680 [Globodera pallida]
MYATWNFLKRHRGKIAAGLTVVGTLYSTKKLLETNAVGAYINSVKKSIGVSEAAADGEVEECLVEARRHFLFDVHQQSCDKSLRMIIAELKSRIAIRFNTEELLDELRSSTELTTQRKIEIWEQLKVRSVSRLVSLVTVYPLTILVLKSQKSIVCQQLCHSAHNKATRDEGSSIFSHGVAFVNSFLCSDQNSGRIQQTDELTGDLTELFNNAIAYFQEDGVALLMGIIERIVCQIFDKVSLGEQLNAKDFLFLIERVRAKVEEICGENYVDFVVPSSEVNLANFGVVENAHLRILLQHLTDVVKSRDARRLTKQFGGQYLEEAMKFLDEAPLLAVSLPMAKIVPILCDAFDQIGATDYGSTFHTILSSTELHRFTLFVSDCSKRVTAICCVMQQKKRLLKFAEYLGHCSREATDYGKCVASNAERIRKDDCSTEFEKLVACFKKRRAGTSIICGPMKVKRLKRAAHILTFYRYNFRFYPPFSVLLDGTFCQAALQYKINLREQMPKYLAQSVEMSVTKCVLNELEQLGKPLHGALVICQQFRVAFCPHKPMRTASKCIAHLARRSRDEGNPKYIVGTQDDELMGELRNFGGVPILSIRFNTILLEQPSEESKIIAENKPSEELERVKELKNEATVPREKKESFP